MRLTDTQLYVLQNIADDHAQDILLLVGFAEASGKTTIVTWGRQLRHKYVAASAGERIENALGLRDELKTVHEDFRREGEAAVEVDRLRRALRDIQAAMASIVVSVGEDAGVILLSSESPTHYDPLSNCQVYDHENFSPLGAALVSVARLAAAATQEGR